MSTLSRTPSVSGTQVSLDPRVQLVRKPEPAKEKVENPIEEKMGVKPVSFAVDPTPEFAVIVEQARESFDLQNNERKENVKPEASAIVEDSSTTDLQIENPVHSGASSSIQVAFSVQPSPSTHSNLPLAPTFPEVPTPKTPAPPAPQADLYLLGSGWDLKRKMLHAGGEKL